MGDSKQRVMAAHLYILSCSLTLCEVQKGPDSPAILLEQHSQMVCSLRSQRPSQLFLVGLHTALFK